ncbi:MAG: addiction module toxin RelE [Neptuniibacter caesariensis]|uniref:Addiction module toxin RelE n=1 Tax=Neptuniibacter caesariensis TaxID=207954 RepID=A0A2G6JBE1_NEPCE|nr:MAG: addiction module toxin RelE [Neptuniibacter caesariensis]
MKVLGKKIVEDFSKKHSRAKGPLNAWVEDAEAAIWATLADIKKRYAHVSFLSNNKAIFNIGGNKFRLEVLVRYANGIILVERVNTHAEYDKKNKQRKQ